MQDAGPPVRGRGPVFIYEGGFPEDPYGLGSVPLDAVKGKQ